MKTLLLLHGAIGAKDQLQPLAELLAGKYNIHMLSFSGHGNMPLSDEGFSIPIFSKEVLAYIEREGLQDVSVFGYSMGGYVAMYMARHYPGSLQKIVTLASKFHWDTAIAEKETKMLDADKIELKLPAFASTLKNRHTAAGWKELLQKTARMMREIGERNPLNPEDYPAINNPSLILLGDRDKMISLEETLAVYKALPDAQMSIIPNTHHPIEQTNIPLLAALIKYFV
jgi:pimeloyl-ACP methyl ester carboxylesterase